MFAELRGGGARHAAIICAPHAAIDDREVGKTILIQIDKRCAETGAVPRGVGQSSLRGLVLKKPRSILHPEHIILFA